MSAGSVHGRLGDGESSSCFSLTSSYGVSLSRALPWEMSGNAAKGSQSTQLASCLDAQLWRLKWTYSRPEPPSALGVTEGAALKCLLMERQMDLEVFA